MMKTEIEELRARAREARDEANVCEDNREASAHLERADDYERRAVAAERTAEASGR